VLQVSDTGIALKSR